jgi:hypothetical protein
MKHHLIIEQRDVLLSFLAISIVTGALVLFKGHDEYVFGLGMLTGIIAMFFSWVLTHYVLSLYARVLNWAKLTSKNKESQVGSR